MLTWNKNLVFKGLKTIYILWLCGLWAEMRGQAVQVNKEIIWFPGTGVQSWSQWNHLETQVVAEPRGDYGYWTLTIFLQIEKLCCVDFLMCAETLFHESVQIIVLRIRVITGKQSWNLRSKMSKQLWHLSKIFFLSRTQAVQMWQLPLHQTTGNDFLGLKISDLANDQFSGLFFSLT